MKPRFVALPLILMALAAPRATRPATAGDGDPPQTWFLTARDGTKRPHIVFAITR